MTLCSWFSTRLSCPSCFDSLLPPSSLPAPSCCQTALCWPFNTALGFTYFFSVPSNAHCFFFCSFSLHPLSIFHFFSDVGSVEGLAYHRGWDMLYWTSYTTSTITRHTVDQSRWGAVDRHTVVTMSGDDHPRAFVLDECQRSDQTFHVSPLRLQYYSSLISK